MVIPAMKSLLFAAALLALAQGASAQAVIPDPTLTPGAVRSTDAEEVCSNGTRQFRHPHDATAIMAEYGLPPELAPTTKSTT